MMPRKKTKHFLPKIWGYRHKNLPSNRTPYLIDNVVDTGNTAKAAIRTLGFGTVASFAMSDTLLQKEEIRCLHR